VTGASHLGLDEPSPWVARFAPLIPQGEVLDLACGGGRHARLLASLGHAVQAVDRDADALQRATGPGITVRQMDLEGSEDSPCPWPFQEGVFAGIVVTNYLHRPLFPGLLASLASGGVLIYETFALGNERFGRPSSPRFLLRPGELLDAVRAHGQDRANDKGELRVIAFEDGYIDLPKPAMVQRICVLKADAQMHDLASALALRAI
jgi:SAM-dependent methyltransferase